MLSPIGDLVPRAWYLYMSRGPVTFFFPPLARSLESMDIRNVSSSGASLVIVRRRVILSTSLARISGNKRASARSGQRIYCKSRVQSYCLSLFFFSFSPIDVMVILWIICSKYHARHLNAFYGHALWPFVFFFFSRRSCRVSREVCPRFLAVSFLLTKEI